ncbi:succinylglutamate desuccinylase/aspartoacylase family protein [Thalassotalea psychrophila]|uniref:Succinylglutamate desuccinylase/aspartoacylase family protein n=1 Tax=Thalassotalea psychrophila TaxID=3065647 RepID=A0ABY9TQA6_9GAMM|nr:succinylglutamate desuccinylase/aspartoacylase family protein [Colwelliaceae bacterium SQ149]
MLIDFNEINYLQDPDQYHLKADYDQFLMSICGPTVIDISGKDQTRTRVITTLIHGDESSGLIAIHRWLTGVDSTSRPTTNLRFIFCSPESASQSPRLSHRTLPDGMDLNRCFGKEIDYGYFKRAQIIEQAILDVNPEVVVDLHNTSGFSPAFSVSTAKNEMALSLTSLFCQSLVLSDIRLGALMEQNFGCEAITIECGSSEDAQSHEVAYMGIDKLAQLDDISCCHHKLNVDIYLNPLRLRLKPDTELSYSCTDEGREGVTLCNNIEQHNFGVIRANQMLGWLDDEGLSNLQIIDTEGKNVINKFFTLRDNQLVTKVDLDIFMATKNEVIAKTDCLLYLVPQNFKL